MTCFPPAVAKPIDSFLFTSEPATHFLLLRDRLLLIFDIPENSLRSVMSSLKRSKTLALEDLDIAIGFPVAVVNPALAFASSSPNKEFFNSLPVVSLGLLKS